MTTDTLLGAPRDRIDGSLKVAGRATYAYEHQVPGALYGVLAGASIARGRIVTLDTAAAEAVPGVVAVLTHQNAPPQAPPCRRRASPRSPDRARCSRRTASATLTSR